MRNPIRFFFALVVAIALAVSWSMIVKRPEHDAPNKMERSASRNEPLLSHTKNETESRIVSAEPLRAGSAGSVVEARPASAFDSDGLESADGADLRLPPTRDEPSFEFVRTSLAVAIESHLPSRTLSATELDVATDATLRLRRAQDALRKTPKDREHANQRAAIRSHLEEAISAFSDVLGMSPAEFTRLVQPNAGIDSWTESTSEKDREILIRPIQPLADEE